MFLVMSGRFLLVDLYMVLVYIGLRYYMYTLLKLYWKARQ